MSSQKKQNKLHCREFCGCMLPLLFWGLYDPVFIVTDILLANHYVVFCQFMLKLYHLFSTLSNYITSANNYHSLQLPTLALELWINWIHSFINCLALLIYLIAYWLLFDVLPVPEFHLSFLANLNSSCICLEASINLLWTQEAPVNTSEPHNCLSSVTPNLD